MFSTLPYFNRLIRGVFVVACMCIQNTLSSIHLPSVNVRLNCEDKKHGVCACLNKARHVNFSAVCWCCCRRRAVVFAWFLDISCQSMMSDYQFVCCINVVTLIDWLIS